MICDACPDNATVFFQAFDVRGKMSNHQLCKKCFDEMLKEEYD